MQRETCVGLLLVAFIACSCTEKNILLAPRVVTWLLMAMSFFKNVFCQAAAGAMYFCPGSLARIFRQSLSQPPSALTSAIEGAFSSTKLLHDAACQLLRHFWSLTDASGNLSTLALQPSTVKSLFPLRKTMNTGFDLAANSCATRTHKFTG